MSTRETILVALKTLLSGLCAGRIYRSRKEQIGTAPAIVIAPETEEDPGLLLGCRDATLTVAITIFARGDIPDQAADPIIDAVFTLINANPTLGLGSDVQILPPRETEWAIENYDDAEVTLRIHIVYRTFT